MRTVSFEEVVLIHVAVGGRVALDAAYGIGARHGRIIEAKRNEVNAGVWTEGGSQNETGLRETGSKSERRERKIDVE